MAAGSSGIPSAVKWLRHWSRSWAVVIIFIANRRFFQQRLILGRRACIEGVLPEHFAELVARFDGKRFPAGTGPCLRGQNPLDGRP